MKTKNLRTLAIAWTLLFWVTSAASNFMHYETVDGIGTITICDPNDSIKCITMQDMNLWASKSGTTCSSADTWACGNHYQRWNNYWFANPWVNGADNITSSATNETISTEWYWPWNYFSWSIFRKIKSSPYDWSSPKNDNLRWWKNDSAENNWWLDLNNPSDRKWPCDTWYHVPSAGEWWTLIQYWAGNYTWAWNSLTLGWTAPLNYFSSNNSTAEWQFKEDFMIPFAGVRVSHDSHDNTKDGTLSSVESIAIFWSSSPDSNRARFFYMYSSSVAANQTQNRTPGYSVRCFKDSALGSSSSEGGASTGQVTLTLTAWENTCTLNDYNLGTHNVSSDDQNVSTPWQNIVCEFLKNPWATIQLSMWDLIDWTKEIWRQYFTWIVTSLWNSLWTIANLTWWSYNFLSSHVIYTKEANTIWTWTWSLAIEWIIPAWTPSWEYTWELNIVICEGC